MHLMAASRMDITESTTPLMCGDMDQRPTEKTYNWKGKLIVYERQTVMRLYAESFAVGVAEDPMAMDNSGPSARGAYTADQTRSRSFEVVVNR